MSSTPNASVGEALRSLVREFQERADRPSVDPLSSVGYRLDERSPEGPGRVRAVWSVVAVHESGHGPESAHVLEDELEVRLVDGGEAELVRRSLFGDDQTRRITWSGDDLEPLLQPVREFCEGFLPPAPGKDAETP